MKFVVSMVFLAATASSLVACSGTDRPKSKPPAGPPPEYEAPRSFDLPKPAGEQPPADSAAPAEQTKPSTP